MANVILGTHYTSTTNEVLTSYSWPTGSTDNPVLATHDTSYPPLGGGIPTLTHGSSYTLSKAGGGFGSRSQQTPVMHFKGNSTSAPTWFEEDSYYPPAIKTPAGFASELSRGTVALPSSRYSHYYVMGRTNPHENIGPYSSFLTHTYPYASLPCSCYASWYFRFDPTWTSGTSSAVDRQYKACDIGNSPQYDGDHYFLSYDSVYGSNEGAVPVAAGNWQFGSGLYTSPSTALASTNPVNGWIRLEVVWTADVTGGYTTLWEVTSVGGRKSRLSLDGTVTAARPSLPGDGLGKFLFGGYVRDFAPDNFVYMTDMFLDSGTTRVVLSDTDSLANSSATYREPQSYTAWSDTSIDLTINAGAVPTGTAYLLVVTGKSTVVHTQEINLI
jgi:hypothetical protein